MSNQNNTVRSVTDIIELIKIAKNNGALRLTVGDVDITFETPPVSSADDNTFAVPADFLAPRPTATAGDTTDDELLFETELTHE